jgi:hypothetical protein
MKNIDWENFIINTMANNFLLHMRIYKKAKERLRLDKQANSNLINSSASNQSVNEDLSLIELFFDVEADIEKGICRDEISQNSNGKEQGINLRYRFIKSYLFFFLINRISSRIMRFDLLFVDAVARF